MTQSKASLEPFAPSRPYLSKVSKYNPRPGYFVPSGNHILVDVDHPEWIAMIEKRGLNPPAQSGKAPVVGKRSPKKPVKPVKVKRSASETKKLKEVRQMSKESHLLNMEERRLKIEERSLKVETRKLQFKKESNEVLDWPLATFLYFGYMEKVGIELLNLVKKIEPMIDNLVKEGDTAGVLKKFHKEHQAILNNAKKAQKSELKEWEAGN